MADEQSNRKSSPILSGMTGPRGGPPVRTGERAKDTKSALRRLMQYLTPYRRLLVCAGLISALGTSMVITAPYLMGRAIDQLVDQNIDNLFRTVLLMAAAYGVAAVAQWIQGIMIVKIAQKAVRTMRSDLFSHMQSLSLKFFDTRSQGELMSRLTNDMDAISRVLTNHATQLFSGVLTLAGVLAVMVVLSPWLAMGSLIAFPLMLGLVATVGKRTRKTFRSYQEHLGNLNAVLEETYSGQRVVLAFGQEESVLDGFDKVNEAVRLNGVKAMSLALVVMPMMGILSNLNIAILCGLGGWLAIRGLVSVGTIAAFISYSRRFAEPLRQLGDLYNQIQAALAGAERIFEILDIVPDQTDSPGALELSRIQGDVYLDHVTFSYLPGVPILKDICIHARPGERIALVGPTGAGKTTLVNLLSRFYDIESGTILIDSQDIYTVSRDSLRRQLGVVLQQSFLFSESVIANIRYGRLEATDEEVFTAARLAHADGFIRRLPQGYGTLLSERGGSLSEGQRQLLSIARAILADPAILILDEATSSVDTRTELFIQQALERLMQGRTSFVIAHRLSTIVNADRVIVIDNGHIAEQGTHQELLAQKGVYHRMYMSQFHESLTTIASGK